LDNDDNFGKPGIYDVYRAGDIFESPLGFLSFGMDEKQSLDYVALHNNAAIKEYAIDVRNPLYVKGTSFDDIQDELARKYTGKSILDDDLSLDEIRLIMNNACEEIEKEGYDSIVQVVENRITGTKKYEVGVLNGHLDTIKLKSDYLDDINGVKPAKKSTTVIDAKVLNKVSLAERKNVANDVIEKAYGKYQYHATTPQAVFSIFDKGLKPNRGHAGKGIYFAPTKADALEWTATSSTGGTRTMRVKTSDLYKKYDWGPLDDLESIADKKISAKDIEIEVAGEWISLDEFIKRRYTSYRMWKSNH
jgi:hypothetical protein